MISKKLLSVILLPIIAIIIIISGYYGFKITKENAIKGSLSHIFKPLPMKNLDVLFDKQGIRAEEKGGRGLEADDKGVWELKSFTTKRKGEEGDTVTEGVEMKFNRQTHDASGYYFIDKDNYNSETYEHDKEEKHYPVEYKNKKLKLTKEAKEKGISKSLEQKINNFKFLVEFADYSDIKDYKNGTITYSYGDRPSYTAEYQLDNKDKNVKEIKNRFDINTNKAPKVLFDESGNMGARKIGDQHIEYNFVDNDKETITYTDIIEFTPSEDEEDNEVSIE